MDEVSIYQWLIIWWLKPYDNDVDIQMSKTMFKIIALTC